MTFEDFGGGTLISYEAKLTLRGPFTLADPLLALAFRRIGERALAGLRSTLAASGAPALR